MVCNKMYILLCNLIRVKILLRCSVSALVFEAKAVLKIIKLDYDLYIKYTNVSLFCLKD